MDERKLKQKVETLNDLLGKEVYEIQQTAVDSDKIVHVSRELQAGNRPLAGKSAPKEEMVTHLEFAIAALRAHAKNPTPKDQSRLGASDQ
jgi:hypothetical protein